MGHHFGANYLLHRPADEVPFFIEPQHPMLDEEQRKICPNTHLPAAGKHPRDCLWAYLVNVNGCPGAGSVTVRGMFIWRIAHHSTGIVHGSRIVGSLIA